MLSKLLFCTRIFSVILRGNAHISKKFLRIVLLGATLSTKIYTGPGERPSYRFQLQPVGGGGYGICKPIHCLCIFQMRWEGLKRVCM